MTIDSSNAKHNRLGGGGQVPRGAKLLGIVDAYANLAEAVPCGLPHCHTPHKKGMVVRFRAEDGSEGEGMVGHICGAHFFGADWQQQLKEHEKRVRISALRERAAGTLREICLVETVLGDLLCAAKAVSSARKTIFVSARRIQALCADAVKSRRSRLAAPYDMDPPAPVRLRGPTFWTRVEDTGAKAGRLVADVRIIRQRIADPSTTMSDLSAMLTKFGSARERAVEIARELLADLPALDPGHLEEVANIATWITDAESLRVEGDTLLVLRGGTDGPSQRWDTVLNLLPYRTMTKQLEQIIAALTT